MKLPVIGPDPTAYNTMFYGITGTFLLLMLIGIGFTLVSGFRYMGGRTADHEIISANALHWYFLSAAFFAVWFVVYVTK